MALFRETDDNRDERLSETEFTTAFANRFEAWDWNKDGGLDPRELNGGLLQLMPPPPDQMRGPGGRLEAEGGQRDPVRMQPEWRPRGPEQGLRPLDGPLVPLATTLIRMADPDNDRRATPDEWRTASQRWFREWDKDRSGQLEPRELAESLEQALGQPGPDR
jgi:hypothetical protein